MAATDPAVSTDGATTADPYHMEYGAATTDDDAATEQALAVALDGMDGSAAQG